MAFQKSEFKKAIEAYDIINQNTKDIFKKLVNEYKVQKHLESLKQHHPVTYEHSLRVGLLSMQLGYNRNLNSEDIQKLGYAGLLHDVGKIRIAKKILNKNSELSALEKDIIKEHPRSGYEELNDFDEGIRHIVLDHHKYQIDNYPKEEPNREVSRLAQIVSISDMYDALSNKRSYKDAFSLERIKEIIVDQFKGNSTLFSIIF